MPALISFDATPQGSTVPLTSLVLKVDPVQDELEAVSAAMEPSANGVQTISFDSTNMFYGLSLGQPSMDYAVGDHILVKNVGRIDGSVVLVGHGTNSFFGDATFTNGTYISFALPKGRSILFTAPTAAHIEAVYV
jgi:hypothetical protein